MRRMATFLFLLALSASASARTDGADAFELSYGMYWGGFHVADVWLSYDPEADAYRSDFRLETVGLADTLLRYRGTASSEGRRTAADGFLPETFRFRDSSRRTTHATDITFDPGTGDAIRIDARREGEPRETDVPPELWRDVLDPLAAFLQMRRDLAGLRHGERISVPVFDGRRRYDLVARVAGRDRITLDGHEREALRVELTIKPLAGFDEEDWEDAGYGDEGIRVSVLLSDDERLIPLRIRTLNTPINLVFNLRQDCPEAGTCEAASG